MGSEALYKTANCRRYLTVLVPITLGLMAKPQITFPFILLLWDGSGSTKTSFGELIMEKVLLFALSVANSIVTDRAQAARGAMSNLQHLVYA